MARALCGLHTQLQMPQTHLCGAVASKAYAAAACCSKSKVMSTTPASPEKISPPAKLSHLTCAAPPAAATPPLVHGPLSGLLLRDSGRWRCVLRGAAVVRHVHNLGKQHARAMLRACIAYLRCFVLASPEPDLTALQDCRSFAKCREGCSCLQVHSVRHICITQLVLAAEKQRDTWRSKFMLRTGQCDLDGQPAVNKPWI